MAGGAPHAAAGEALELRCEARADEWHFDEGAHQAQVEAAAQEAAAHRAREAAAVERLQRTELEADEGVAEALAAAAAEEQRIAKVVAGLREQAQEEAERGEDLSEDCDREVQDIERRIEAERARRLEVEAALRDEREQLEKASLREAEVQESAREAAREKGERLRRLQAESQARIAAAQRASEERVREAEGRARRQVEAVELEMQQARLQQRSASGAEVAQRREALGAVDREVVARVDAQVRQALNATQSEAEDVHHDACQQIKDIRGRDLALEESRVRKHGLAQEALAGSQEQMHQAAMAEKLDKGRALAAAEVLGPVYHRSAQFSLAGPPRKSLPPPAHRAGPLGLTAQAIVTPRACD